MNTFKKLLASSLGFLAVFFFIFSPLSLSAQEATKPLTLSDAVLADLALHNYLDYVSIDFKDKKSPNTVTINQERQWLPASTIKLFVAIYAAEEIQKKDISLDQWVTIDDKNVVPTEMETDEYPVLTAGLTTTVEVLLKKMITQSDNTAYNTLLDLLDRQKVTEYVQSLGLTHTIIGSKLNLDDNQTQYEYTTPGYNINTTTAADYEKAYELIDANKIADSTLLFDILRKQKIQNMIPEFLPIKNLTIAHKTGDLDPLYHDGGIIIGDNKHYILTIFTNLGNPYVLAHISQLIFTKNYKLVGATIPDKDSINPQTPQALDPLVVNPQEFKPVLGAQTQINVPIPQITAADLGITAKELSLVLPDSKLPPSIIPPNSPFHLLIPLWYGAQTFVALGEKNRQHVALTYAKQLIADAKKLQEQGTPGQVSSYMQHVQNILNAVASDKVIRPDPEMQLEIQSVSQTQFAVLKKQVTQTANDAQRIALIQQIANQAKQTITSVVPNTPQAKTLAAASQQPLIGQVIDSTPGHVIIQTNSGQQVQVALTNETKILKQSSAIQAPVITPLPSPILTATLTPTQTVLSPATLSLQKGATVALVGTIQGTTFTPSVIATNIPRELAAPQPVSVIKVNPKNDTMIVAENGIPIQVDLSPNTAIKAKDTNIPLSQIHPGSIVVVHGTTIEQVRSDTPRTLQTAIPTTQLTATPAVSPTSKSHTTGEKMTPIPTLIPGNVKSISPTQATSNKPTTILEKKTDTSTPFEGKAIVPVVPPSQAIGTSANPKVIQATSVQVVQQKQTTTQIVPTKPTTQPNPAQKSGPAPQPAHNPPEAPKTQSSPSQEVKNKRQ